MKDGKEVIRIMNVSGLPYLAFNSKNRNQEKKNKSRFNGILKKEMEKDRKKQGLTEKKRLNTLKIGCLTIKIHRKNG